MPSNRILVDIESAYNSNERTNLHLEIGNANKPDELAASKA